MMKLLLLTLFVAVASAIPIPSDESGPVEVIVVGIPEGQALDLDHVLDVKVNEHVDGQLISASNALYPFTAEGIQAAIAALIPEAVPTEEILPEAAVPEIGAPQPVVLPEAAVPETILEPVVLPEAAVPETILEPVVLPEAELPETILEPVEPQAPAPEVVEQPEETFLLPEITKPETVLPVEATPEIAPVLPAMPVAQVDETPEDVVDDVVNAEDDVPVAEDEPVALQGEVYNDGNVQVNVNAQTGLLATLQSWFNLVINKFNSQGVQVSNQII